MGGGSNPFHAGGNRPDEARTPPREKPLLVGTGASADGGNQMRVVVVGATGNVGTSVVRSLARGGVDDVLAVARRAPLRPPDGARFQSADITTDNLEPIFR